MNMLGNILYIMALLAGIGFVLYWFLSKNQKRKTKKSYNAITNDVDNAGNTKENQNTIKKISNDEIKDLIGVEAIDEEGVIKNCDGSYRAQFLFSTPDVELLTEEEFENYENALMSFGLSLNFPVLIKTTTTTVETKEPTQRVIDLINSDDKTISKELREYASNLKKEQEAMGQIYVRGSFITVGVNDIDDKKRAITELKNRCDTVISGLSQAKIKIGYNDVYKRLQLLTDSFNKTDKVNIQNIIENGALETYSEGLGVMVNVEEKQ